MKKQQSVFALAARRALPGTLVILAVMAAAEFALFIPALSRSVYPEQVLELSRCAWVLAAGFVAECVLLVLPRLELGGRQSYTLRRLSVTGPLALVWETAAHTLCFFLLWAGQTAITLGLYALFAARAEEGQVSGQTLLLFAYRSELFHSLLPLREGSRWVRNGLLCLALGSATAASPRRMALGKRGSMVVLVILMGAVLLSFPLELGRFGSDLLMSVWAVLVTVGMFAGVWGLTDGEDDDEI